MILPATTSIDLHVFRPIVVKHVEGVVELIIPEDRVWLQLPRLVRRVPRESTNEAPSKIEDVESEGAPRFLA